MCAHDMQGKPVASAPQAEAPPCHPQEPAAEKAAGKPDCCGSMCQCATGTCHTMPHFIGAKLGDILYSLSTAVYFNKPAALSSFMPEQATPPPRQ